MFFIVNGHLLRRVFHALWLGVSSAIDLLCQLFFTEFGFLVLLDERAASTAARGEQISDAVALEVVLLADVGTLEHHRNEVKPEAGEAGEHEALFVRGRQSA